MIITDPRDPRTTPLLATLIDVLPAVRARLDDAGAWRGFVITDPSTGAQRKRLVCRDRIRDAGLRRTYALSLHAFDDVGAKTAMHDHRVPIAVFPFALALARTERRDNEALYEMAWRMDESAGNVVVRAGDAWAIVDHTRVFHAVHTLRAHGSVVLADVTSPPSRPDRMTSLAMSEADVNALRARLSMSLSCGAGARPPFSARSVTRENGPQGPDPQM